MMKHSIFDISVIEEILPHRRPFLFVDRVLNFKAGEHITTERDLFPNESFFSGHFPGRPIMPGVLISETLAQTSGLLLGLTWKEQKQTGNLQKHLFLANLSVKFKTLVKPDETLQMESHISKTFGRLSLFEVRARVEDRLIAKGTLALGEESPESAC